MQKINGQWRVFSQQLISNSVTRLTKQSKQTLGLCKTNTSDKGVILQRNHPLFPNELNIPQNVEVEMRTSFINANNQRWCPSADVNSEEDFHTNTIGTLELYAKVKISALNADSVCESQVLLDYKADLNPATVSISRVVNGGGIPLTDGDVSCGKDLAHPMAHDSNNPNTIAPNLAKRISYEIVGSEPGMVFI